MSLGWQKIIPLITEASLTSYFAAFGQEGFFPWPYFHPELCFTLGPIFRMRWWCLQCQILVKRHGNIHSEGINISHLFIYLTNNCKGWPFTHLLGSVSTSPGFQEICCSSTNPERALGQFLRSRGADVGANELVMSHILGSLAAPSSATVSSQCAIRNKVCDTALS